MREVSTLTPLPPRRFPPDPAQRQGAAEQTGPCCLLAEPDKRRRAAPDKGLARTKSTAPINATKSLVKWSSKDEPPASQAKTLLQTAVSRQVSSQVSIASANTRGSDSGKLGALCSMAVLA